MKNSKQKYSDSGLLLKSVCSVAGAALLVLLFMHHAVPVRSGDKGYGSGVKLLLPENIADVDEFYRWAELNKPSNVFGYNSAGLFTRSVTLKSKVVLPKVRSGMSQEEILHSPAVPSAAELPVRMEKNIPGSVLLQPEKQEGTRAFQLSGIPVFSDKGEPVCTLEGFSDSKAGNPLLIKAENSVWGTRFRIIETSGDRSFDSRVTAVLEQKVRSGSRFSGILAVWPRKGEKK